MVDVREDGQHQIFLPKTCHNQHSGKLPSHPETFHPKGRHLDQLQMRHPFLKSPFNEALALADELSPFRERSARVFRRARIGGIGSVGPDDFGDNG